MVESRARKAAFLQEAIRTLDLDKASVVSQRIEDRAQSVGGAADLSVTLVRGVRMDHLDFTAAIGLLHSSGHLLWFTSVHEFLLDTLERLTIVGQSPLPALGTLSHRLREEELMFHVEQYRRLI